MKTSLLSAAPKQKRVLSLGAFDGVHYAHRAVLMTACTEARLCGALSAVFTFSQDPSVFLNKPQPMLNTFSQRETLIRAAGVDEIVYATFDDAMRTRSPEDFFSLLCETLTPVCLVCGYNYTFGNGGKGNVALLRALCEARNIKLTVLEPISLGGITVSSTEIRSRLAAGEIAAANRLLGYPFTVCGTVIHGNERGKTFGFPTANIPCEANRAAPAYGVYLSRVRIGECIYPAVTDFGLRPTVNQTATPLYESHLLHFSGDLYGREIAVELLQYLRPEQAFSSEKELISAIFDDVKAAERFFNE